MSTLYLWSLAVKEAAIPYVYFVDDALRREVEKLRCAMRIGDLVLNEDWCDCCEIAKDHPLIANAFCSLQRILAGCTFGVLHVTTVRPRKGVAMLIVGRFCAGISCGEARRLANQLK